MNEDEIAVHKWRRSTVTRVLKSLRLSDWSDDNYATILKALSDIHITVKK